MGLIAEFGKEKAKLIVNLHKKNPVSLKSGFKFLIKKNEEGKSLSKNLEPDGTPAGRYFEKSGVYCAKYTKEPPPNYLTYHIYVNIIANVT